MKIEFLFRALKTLIVTRRSADMGVGETQKVKASGEKKKKCERDVSAGEKEL